MTSRPRSLGRRLIGRAAPLIPLGAYLRLIPRGPIGFLYHIVSDQELPHLRHLFPYKSLRAFEADLRWLTGHTLPLHYSDLIAAIEQRAGLPKNTAFLSFDDGYAECFTVVRPLLLKYRLPCIFFLTTDWIDNRAMYYRCKVSLVIEHLTSLPEAERRPALSGLADRRELNLPDFSSLEEFITWIRTLEQSEEAQIDRICELLGVDVEGYLAARRPFLSRAQISTMQSEGFVFGAHSRRHAKLATLPPEEQAEEILASCRRVAGITGEAEVPFSFPFSGSSVDREMLRGIREAHPEVGPIFDTGRLAREPGVLHRIWVDKPVPGVHPQDNLSYWLRDAYRRLLEAGRG